MLNNYLKLSLRLMARNSFFTFINIFGLAVGFASFFALWNFSIQELQSDQYHKDYDRIARIGWHWRFTDDGKKWDHFTVGFSKSDIPIRVKEDFPEVEDFTRIHAQQFFGRAAGLVPLDRRINMAVIGQKEENVFKEEHVVYADQNLFNFFSIPLTRGDANQVLKDAGSIVISESQSVKYFGKQNPIGELLKANDTITLKVTGVFKDLPHNTHLNFDMVISNSPYVSAWASAFNSPTVNYIKLRKGVSFGDFEEKLSKRKQDYFAALLQVIANTDIDMFVQPLDEIIYSANFPGDEFTPRSKSLLITFTMVSIVLLAMAWVNYINLWIARNKKREKELATRKINGARSKDFVFQFLTESAVINLLAVLLAITFLQFARIPFKHLFNIQINDLWQSHPQSLVVFGLVFLISICLTGLYPAWVARNNHPLALFRKSGAHGSSGVFSSGLVVIQYASAVVLILWSSIVYLELNHVLQKETGLDRENVFIVEVPATKNTEGKLDGLINDITSNPSIENAAYGIFAPGEGSFTVNTRRRGSATQVGFEWNGVSEDYFELFGLKLMAGRNFVPSDKDDVVILSEVAVQRLGFENPADAVGTKLEMLKWEASAKFHTVEIIGILKEFRTMPFFETSISSSNLQNEYQSQGKLFIYKNRGLEIFQPERLAIKIKTGELKKAITWIEDAYSVAFPGTPFTWFFLEDSMNKAYLNEKITRNRILLFVVLAIIIACLGFQGMIMHKVTSKTKEIGIRKILGAGTAHISQVILQPSSIQFGISMLIGVPIAWYLGELYLQKFSERIVLQWWHYAMPVLALMMIMLCTVAMLLWKAAKNNPVDALKYE